MKSSSPATVSLREAVESVAAALDGPVSRADLIGRVLALHPSRARRPEGLVLAEARQYAGMVRLEDGAFASWAWVLRGATFRYVPGAEEVESGAIPLFPCFAGLLPPSSTVGVPRRLTLLDAETGQPAGSGALSERCAPVAMGGWLDARGFAAGDSLHLTIQDPAQAVFGVRREAAADIDTAAVARQDATLEAVLTELVEKDPSEQPFLEEIIPMALARLSAEARAYPGSHWHEVVRRSARLRPVDDYAIARATFRRPIDRILGYSVAPSAQKELEARIETFNADLARTLDEIGAPPSSAPATPLALCGRDEALRRSMRQIAAFLAAQPGQPADECTRCLAAPSIYLAKHEGVSLAEADFDMLRRFLLSYYPRRVLFNRKSFTRRMLATLRRFYLAAPSVGEVTRIHPHHLSRLHTFIDRKISLYAEISLDTPAGAAQFARLFPDVEQDDAEMVPMAGEFVLAAR